MKRVLQIELEFMIDSNLAIRVVNCSFCKLINPVMLHKYPIKTAKDLDSLN